MHESLDNSIWISYRNIFGSEHYIFSRLDKNLQISHPLKSKNYVRAISSTKEGKVWFATAGSGLLSYDEHGIIPYHLSDGLPKGTISKIRSHQDEVWLLFTSEWPVDRKTIPAIYSIDLKNKQPSVLKGSSKLFPHDIELDSSGNLVILANSGLFIFNGQIIEPLSTKHFSSIIPDQNQELWLHSDNSVYLLNKDQKL